MLLTATDKMQMLLTSLDCYWQVYSWVGSSAHQCEPWKLSTRVFTWTSVCKTIRKLTFFFKLCPIRKFGSLSLRKASCNWTINKWWEVIALKQLTRGCLLGGVFVPCIYHMPGGYGRQLVSLLCACSMCDVNCSSSITSHCLLILQQHSRPHSVSDYSCNWVALPSLSELLA